MRTAADRARRWAPPLVAAFFVFGVVLAWSGARAQAQPDEDPRRAAARRVLEEAEAHMAARRFGLAAQGFEDVYARMREMNMARAPLMLWNLGLALLEMPGREPAARRAFERFLAESEGLTQDPLVVEYRGLAQQHVADLDARGVIDASAPGGGGISPIGPILLGTAAAVLGVGAVLGGLALARDGDLAAQCGGTACADTRELRALHGEMTTFAAIADTMFVVGGVVAAVGLVLTFVLTEGSPPSSASRAELRVRVAPGELRLDVLF